LIDFQSGCLRDIGCELRAEFYHVVGEERGLVAGAGDGDVGEAGVEQIWVDTRVGIDEDALGGRALGAVTGDGVAVVEMTMLAGVEFDLAVVVEFQTAGSYRSVLNKYVSPRWESYKVSEFDRPQVRAAIEQWLASLCRSARNSEGLAPKTVRHIFTTMKLVFKFAVKWGYLEQNPMAEKRVELPRGSTKRCKRPVQLTAAQFLYLLPRFQTRERVAVALAGWLGPRVSEAFGLQWQDLDMESRVVRFRRGFVQGRITPLKTEASRTDLALPEDVVDLLVRWRSITPYNQPQDWVFASPFNQGRRPLWPCQLLKDYVLPVAIKAGLPKIGWHSFRHTVMG
jgi:integrase